MNQIKTRLLLFIPVVLISVQTIAQSGLEAIQSVESVCEAFPERMENLWRSLDLDKQGLEKVKEAVLEKDCIRAGKELLAYYHQKPIPGFIQQQVKKADKMEILAQAKEMLQSTYIFYGQKARVPRNKEGMMQWDFKGPTDDREWAWALNRHFPMQTLYDAYLLSGNDAYVRAINDFIKDWVIQSEPYLGVKSSTAMWRGLEVSFRVKNWATIFYGLMEHKALKPATRILMISSLPAHAHYARNFHGQNNWLTMEMSGLAKLAASWPEFNKSDEWLEYSKGAMTESLKDQVYPDGAQTELTSSYHQVSLTNFTQFKQTLEAVNEELPPYFLEQLEKMWNYIAYTVRPDGYGLLNNDADKKYNKEIVLEAAEKYKRPDWAYIASNGALGKKPKGFVSHIFPWAGHLISRSDYGKDAHWSFFDMGPWGTGHQHNDKLHLSLAAYGRDLLVDAGRFSYTGEVAKKFRPYAQGSQGHNLVLIDGKGQGKGPLKVTEPIGENHYRITEAYDFAWAEGEAFEALHGEAGHQRTIFYLRDKFWIIMDKIRTVQPRQIETLWHWHPACEVVVGEDQSLYSQNERGNLLILPLTSRSWDLSLVKGQEEPEPQGWYSEVYNRWEPNATGIYKTQVEDEAVLVWLLFPYEKDRPAVKGEILDQDSEILLLKITLANKTYELTVPFQDADKIVIKDIKPTIE